MDNVPKIEAEASAWVARVDRNLLPHEEEALEQWMMADRRHQGALLRAQACFALLDRGRALDPVILRDDGEGWARRHLLRIGGGGIAAMMTAGLAWRFWRPGQGVATVKGEIRRIPLEDGTLAVVNGGSKLRTVFSPDRRDIVLSDGEAWFEVVKDKGRPFTVTAGRAHIQAVGTAFDVRRNADHVEVIVTEGVVRVWLGGARASAALVRAGSHIRMDDAGAISVSQIAEQRSNERLAWREGRIVLDGMTLGEAASEFNRYNESHLVVSPALAGESMVGWFRTDDIEGFVRAATIALRAQAHRDGNRIVIEPSQGKRPET